MASCPRSKRFVGAGALAAFGALADAPDARAQTFPPAPSAATAPAAASPREGPHGLELGARLGAGALVGHVETSYAAPTAPGTFTFGGALFGAVEGDVGWRFSPALHLGGYLGYGVGALMNATRSDNPAAASAPTLLRAGVAGRAYLPSFRDVAPWLGGSAGWVSLTQGDSSAREDHDHLAGFELALEAGADTRWGFGPWLALGAGVFTSADHTVGEHIDGGWHGAADVAHAAPHAIAALGIRGALDVVFGSNGPALTSP